MSRWKDTVKKREFTGDAKSHPGHLDEILPAPIENDPQSVMEEGRISVPKTRSIAGLSRSYLKKFTNYFTNSSTLGKSRKNPFTVEEKFTVKAEGDNLSSDGSTKELCSVESPKVMQKTTATKTEKTEDGQRAELPDSSSSAGTPNPEYNAFLLPRVCLKQQESGVTMRRSNNSGSEKGYSKSGHERISSSHYSTDKSGSSGYYSSNLYSTGSVDEHIYSEPVIDAIEASAVKMTPKIAEKKNNKTCNFADTLNDDERKVHRSVGYDFENEQHYGSPLERRLSLEYAKRSTQKLPTIMEGIDGQIPRPIWPSDMDDSLVDINLDSFLLNKEKNGQVDGNGSSVEGIINPALDCDDLSESNSLENNYRCAKYVNSCPENPYCVEGVLEDLQSSVDKSLSLYLQKCEDNITIQTTREFLEDIRKKLTTLLEEHYDENGDPLTPTRSTIVRADDKRQSRRKYTTVIKEDIKNLRSDLDDYLKVMNQTNEFEIQQLCTGIARDARLTTMKNALENRMRNQENERRLGSLVMRNFSDGCRGSGRRSLAFYDEDLLHQSEDPNFQLKRKTSPCSSDCDPMAQEIVDSDAIVPAEQSQMQQNIAMQPAPLLLPKIYKGPASEQEMILEWHRNKPSIWEQYYGINRPDQPIIVRKTKITSGNGKKKPISVVSYPSTRPESDFTLDLPRAQQLERKLKEQKRFRSRCKIFAFILSFFFFLVTVMVVSLVLTRGKRMFGSML
ncbi:uncharacterized protein LOC129804968 isoform X2 [Phlebotomus papatasi]|uniref:uncharacterized protein LOC129804968 isoform X2 n=1 Tax=Phlebotomus papatasi TaxID=29031 RepID=UPI00248347D9|nr:uncharacterized protein LOC129804968 isoform X2 [Phlebotomus papatasi]XP_055708738.1 uncharacterized protein LOC129804968 isoform X2 [Phlebotomus papatasi]XP_055708739.1 uncharacterized protein LOC129804968 isoform X2 [Phlebotomus papatasi]XP_055708740.1 uncharacterized protein LOC129804968 isoform X2 [Phlebotomus papatasi]XP_055708741.1 uncharacterized protein LOC129804968 isoform X2 [Phlebotomus papatasi]